MNNLDCLKFANENQICSFATIEDNQPRVRIFGLWFADESGYYFQTNSQKKISNQLKINPKVEICFYKPGKTLGKMLRISGEVEFIHEKKLKEKVLIDRPFLKVNGMTWDNPDLLIFRVAHGELCLWSPENSSQTKKFIKF